MSINPSKSKPQAGAQEAPKDLKKLEESFDKILSGHNAFQRDYLLVKEAKEWNMTLDEYRTLFKSYCNHASKRSFIKSYLSSLLWFWKWTGIAEKQLWDYLQLAAELSIPIVIFIGGQYFASQTNEKQQQIADEHYRQDLLSKYFDQMTDLIIKENLSDPNKAQSNHPQQPQIIARARTLSTLRELDKDGDRKGLLIQFLSEAKLILGKKPVVVLDSANLQGINLQGANLIGANLQGAYLQGANLIGANLIGANLIGANLQGANLQYSYLEKADIEKADIEKADLEKADLEKACLKQVEIITLEPIKSSNNWQKAFYNPELRKRLGLKDTANRKWPDNCP